MQIIEKYFPLLSPLQKEQYRQLGPLYSSWNEKINVISRKDIGNLYERHVLHSLAIARVILFNPGTVIIDAGTGGGFPGIPLAIMFPAARFILVDSIAKKIRVVEDIIHALQLENCEARNLRMENFHEKSDFIVCRAVATIPEIFALTRKNIMPGGTHVLPNGLLALKGGDLEEEVTPMGPGTDIFRLEDYFSEPFFEFKKLVYVPR